MDKLLVNRFHALGDATRLAVLERLLEKPASVSELAEPFAMALPPFTKHLRILENVGLVASSKKGRVRTYCINPSVLDEMDQWFRDRRRLWRSRLDRLEQLLAERENKK